MTKNINELMPDCGKCVWSRITINRMVGHGGVNEEFYFNMDCEEPGETGLCRIKKENMKEMDESTENYLNIVCNDVWRVR